MVAQEETLVAGVNDDGIRGQPGLVEPIQQSAHVIVDRLDTGEVILEVTLIFPGFERVARQLLGFSVNFDFDFGGFHAEPLVALRAL